MLGKNQIILIRDRKYVNITIDPAYYNKRTPTFPQVPDNKAIIKIITVDYQQNRTKSNINKDRSPTSNILH